MRRRERFQMMLSESELRAIEVWRSKKGMPTKASAVRELLRLSLAAEAILDADEAEYLAGVSQRQLSGRGIRPQRT